MVAGAIGELVTSAPSLVVDSTGEWAAGAERSSVAIGADLFQGWGTVAPYITRLSHHELVGDGVFGSGM